MSAELFTSRKLSVAAKLNYCNAQMMCNTERANTLTSSIFAKQSASAIDKANKTQIAYAVYQTAMNAASATTEDGKAPENYADLKADAEAALSKALADIDQASAMTDAEIQGLNMQQTVIDQQKKMLETQLNTYTNELENVSKAEEGAIKKDAPSFK